MPIQSSSVTKIASDLPSCLMLTLDDKTVPARSSYSFINLPSRLSLHKHRDSPYNPRSRLILTMKATAFISAVIIAAPGAYCGSVGPADVGRCCPLPQANNPWAFDMNSVLAVVSTAADTAIAGAVLFYAIKQDKSLRQIAAGRLPDPFTDSSQGLC